MVKFELAQSPIVKPVHLTMPGGSPQRMDRGAKRSLNLRRQCRARVWDLHGVGNSRHLCPAEALSYVRGELEMLDWQRTVPRQRATTFGFSEHVASPEARRAGPQ